MKKLLKSKICGSVNYALFTKKSNISTKKKKTKTKETQNVRLGSVQTHSKSIVMFMTLAISITKKLGYRILPNPLVYIYIYIYVEIIVYSRSTINTCSLLSHE